MSLYYANRANGCTVRSEDDKIIANFYVKVKSVVKYITNNSFIKAYIVEFYNTDFICEEEIYDNELMKLDYSVINDALLLSPTISSAQKEMAYFIKEQAKSVVAEEKKLITKLGWHRMNGDVLYCAGDKIISNKYTNNYKILPNLSDKYHFEIDENLSERDAIIYITKLINIEPSVSSVVFAYGLLGIMRQIVLDADIKIPCIAYIFGNSQTRKTTIANLCTRMYNRSNLYSDTSVSSLRVSSTEFKSEELVDELKDATFVFDDLYKEQNRVLRKKYESNVRNLIRNFADNSSRTTSRSAFKNNCQIIVTAEYLLNSKTDIGRTLLIHINKPIDSKRLAECQKEPLALSTFYFYFIEWLSEKYDMIVNRLKSEYKVYRAESFVHSGKFERLYEQCFLLRFVFDIFLEYALEKNTSISKELYASGFSDYLKKIYYQQNEILEQLDNAEEKNINLSDELISMIADKTIKISKKGSECFEKGNYLYISNSYFGKCLYEKYARHFSSKYIAAYFRDRYISDVYADKRPKKYNNKCYLVLNKADLYKDSKDNSNNIENWFFE